MFTNCESFEGEGLENWDVSKVTNTGSMFYNCKNLYCDLSNWNVSNVKDMSYMFYGCKLFESDLSNWNVSKVINVTEMFKGCKLARKKPTWYKTKSN